jgi:hypothetical protein
MASMRRRLARAWRGGAPAGLPSGALSRREFARAVDHHRAQSDAIYRIVIPHLTAIRPRTLLQRQSSDWVVCGADRYAFRATTTPLVDLAPHLMVLLAGPLRPGYSAATPQRNTPRLRPTTLEQQGHPSRRPTFAPPGGEHQRLHR